MSEGLYHFKFNYQRFLTSTLGWSEEQQGAYLRLLIVQFDQGGIPSNIKEIFAISPAAKKHWKKIGPKFKYINEDGTLYNAFMMETRNDAIEKQEVNSKNGSLGGRPKKNRTVIVEKPNGYENGKRNESEMKPIPVTSNHIVTLKEGESVNTPADISKSNLFRQPNIPAVELVVSVFKGQGGTEEMAQKFFNTNESTGWFLKGSPITNFINLVPGFIANWNKNEKNSTAQQKVSGTSVADAIAAARVKTNA